MFAFFLQCLLALAQNCDCDPPSYPAQELIDAAAVFSGRVTSIRFVDSTELKEEIVISGERLFVQFAVDKVWKGEKKESFVVETNSSTSTCGFPFVVGESYLVYTFYPLGGEDSTTLITSQCTRTRLLATAAEDLEELNTPPRVVLKKK